MTYYKIGKINSINSIQSSRNIENYANEKDAFWVIRYSMIDSFEFLAGAYASCRVLCQSCAQYGCECFIACNACYHAANRTKQKKHNLYVPKQSNINGFNLSDMGRGVGYTAYNEYDKYARYHDSMDSQYNKKYTQYRDSEDSQYNNNKYDKYTAYKDDEYEIYDEYDKSMLQDSEQEEYPHLFHIDNKYSKNQNYEYQRMQHRIED